MSGWFAYLATAAFLAGIAGGVHCAAMCGPILMATSASARGGVPAWRRVLAYNGGRILSYSAAGLAAGAFGSGALALHGGGSVATVLAALSGTAMLLVALHLSGYTPLARALESAGAGMWRRVQPHAKRFLPADTLARMFGLGAVWGWVPCGMVYGALVMAASTASAFEGALVMLAFGLGTLPNVAAVSLAAGRVSRLMRLKPVRLISAAIVGAFGGIGLTFAVHAHPYTVGQIICRFVPAAAPLIQ